MANGVFQMINDLLFLLTLLSALGCGLMGGFFFAFSAVVMNALARLALAQGIAAMQSINAAVARGYKVINPWFGAAFSGTAAACVLLGWLLAGNVARTRCRPLARRLRALSRRHCSGHDRVQRAVERSAGGRRAGQRRRRRPMDPIRRQVDGLEPRANGCGPCGSGIAHHRARYGCSAGHLGAAQCAHQDFVDINIAGALNLPEEAVRQE